MTKTDSQISTQKSRSFQPQTQPSLQSDRLTQSLISNEPKELAKSSINKEQKKAFQFTEKYFVIFLSFLMGFEELASLSYFYYQKDYLHLTPAFIQNMKGIIFTPWTLKPIFGFSFDQIMKVLPKSKYLVYICAVIKITCYLALGYFQTSVGVFFILYFLIVLCNLYISIICEYLLVLSSKKANEETEDKQENHIPIFYGFRCAGMVVGNLISGQVIKRYNIFLNFYISSLIPLLGVATALLYDEGEKVQTKTRTIKSELKIIYSLIFRDSVLPMIIFVVFVNMVPNYDSLT